MTRLSFGSLLATLLVGPWAGCERQPVTPPAVPPPERAPVYAVDPAHPAGSGGVVLLHDAHRRI